MIKAEDPECLRLMIKDAGARYLCSLTLADGITYHVAATHRNWLVIRWLNERYSRVEGPLLLGEVIDVYHRANWPTVKPEGWAREIRPELDKGPGMTGESRWPPERDVRQLA